MNRRGYPHGAEDYRVVSKEEGEKEVAKLKAHTAERIAGSHKAFENQPMRPGGFVPRRCKTCDGECATCSCHNETVVLS